VLPGTASAAVPFAIMSPLLSAVKHHDCAACLLLLLLLMLPLLLLLLLLLHLIPNKQATTKMLQWPQGC
jgi:hypothetical protein